jgi:hypothetical protein
MSFPPHAMVARLWAKCRARAWAGLPREVGEVDLGEGPAPLRFREARDRTAREADPFAERIDQALDATARPNEMTERPSATSTTDGAVHSPADAEQLMLGLTEVMDGLLAVVEEETQLIRAGCADIPAPVEQSKADLARRYCADIARLQRSRPYLRQMMPVSFFVLQQRHKNFCALLQVNLTLLAAERAAAEAPVDDVSVDSSPATSPPHRPRPLRPHLPRLPQARCCPSPRRLEQARRRTVQAQPPARRVALED